MGAVSVQKSMSLIVSSVLCSRHGEPGGESCPSRIRRMYVTLDLCLRVVLIFFFVQQLKKARKEGRLAEAMLDRRAKLKR